MSNNFLYTYKTSSITTDITDVSNATINAPGYNSNAPGYNFLIEPTTYNSLRPVSFGFSSLYVDLSNSCKAKNASYFFPITTASITSPVGAKTLRVSGIGGGGAPGGIGGDAKAKKGTPNNNSATGNGGAGGTGGFGTYTSQTFTGIAALTPIFISLGNAGVPGNNGASHSVNSGGGKASAKGEPGKDGTPGNITTIKIGNGAAIQIGLPGNGGKGGDGATATANTGSTNSSKGAAGAPGNATTAQSAGNFPTQSPYGDTNRSGALQVVWIYE